MKFFIRPNFFKKPLFLLIFSSLFATVACDKKASSPSKSEVSVEEVKSSKEAVKQENSAEKNEQLPLKISFDLPPYETHFEKNPLGEFALARSRIYLLNAGIMSSAEKTPFSLNPIDNLLFRYAKDPKGDAELAAQQLRYLRHDTRGLLLAREVFSSISAPYGERYPALAEAALEVNKHLSSFVDDANKLQGDYASPTFKDVNFARNETLYRSFVKNGEETAAAFAKFSHLFDQALLEAFEKKGNLARAAVVRVVLEADNYVELLTKNDVDNEGISDPSVIAELNRDTETILAAVGEFKKEIVKFNDNQKFGSTHLDYHVFEFGALVREMQANNYKKVRFEDVIRACRILDLELDLL